MSGVTVLMHPLYSKTKRRIHCMLKLPILKYRRNYIMKYDLIDQKVEPRLKDDQCRSGTSVRIVIYWNV